MTHSERPGSRASLYTRLTDLVAIPARHHAVEGPHAQFGEDRILEGIFAGRTQGFCVEVGAYDGRTGSATLLFEGKGWQCLLVEPIPECAEEIRRQRRCIVKGCAASSEEGETTFFVADGVEQMSTVEPDGDHHRWIRDVGGSVREITVRTARLDDLLDEAGFAEVQFITIDVEGHELEVLRGFSLERFRPRVVILEDNLVRGTSRVERHMAEHGYVNFKRTGVNDWYAHDSDAELVEAVAVRWLKRAKRLQRLQEGAIQFATRHLAPGVRRALAGMVKRASPRR